MEAGAAPDRAAAERAVECLRYGLPPLGLVRFLTVDATEGRCALAAPLTTPTASGGPALLISAGRGEGKSHRLHLIRELALEAGYAVSLVALSPAEGVRLDRPETLLGAVCRRLEVAPSGPTGAGTLFDAFVVSGDGVPATTRRLHDAIASRGRWDYSAVLQAPAMYVALRAWVASPDPTTHALIAGWLDDPGRYREQRRLLYEELVHRQRGRFQDPRPEWKFYHNDALVLHGAEPAWAALDDLHTIARAAGRRGLVVLFDDVAEAVLDVDRTDQRQAALVTLCRFWQGRFAGPSYFAVSPDFLQECRRALPLYVGPHPNPSPERRGDSAATACLPQPIGHPSLRTGGAGGEVSPFFDAVQLDQLPRIESVLPPPEPLVDLARRICALHGLAYGWDAAAGFDDGEACSLAKTLGAATGSGAIRRAVQALVATLDRRCGDLAD